MAEALWNEFAKGKWQACSAGSRPAGYVHPLAIEVMAEEGLDISRNVSQHVDDFAGQTFDLAVTVCDNARDACPVIQGARRMLHWSFEDPAAAEGSLDERRNRFREIRDQIRSRITTFLQEEDPAG
jgi:arsenate reductase